MKNSNQILNNNQQNNLNKLYNLESFPPIIHKKTVKLSDIQINMSAEKNCIIVYEDFCNRLRNTVERLNRIQDVTQFKMPNVMKSQDVWKILSIEKNQTFKHFNLITPEVHNDFKGSFFVSSNGWNSPFKKINFNNLNDVKVICMGGIDFYTMGYFRALRESFYNFNLNNKEFINPESVLFYYPLYSKDKRVKELQKFENTGNHISAEMEMFAYKYIIPKILAGEPISFFCYSASCRELLMIEKVCKKYFDGLDINQSKELLSHINVTLVGYAFDWSSNNDSYGFSKTIITSVEDFGVLRSQFNRDLLYGSSLVSPGVTKIFRSEYNSDLAYVFGINSVPIEVNGKINLNGHHLYHYIEAFNNIDNNINKSML